MNLNKKIILSVSLLLISIAYSFATLFYGLNLTDTFYYIEIFKSNELKPMIIGFQLFGKYLINIFGDYIIWLRIVNWLLYACTFIFAYILFVDKKDQKQYLIYLCTLLLLVFLLSSFIKWKNNTNILNSIAIFIVFIFLILFRFPNIVIIPICFILLLFERKYSTLLRYTLLCIVSILCCFLIYIICYGGLDNFINSIFAINSDSNHSIHALIGNYIKDGYVLITYIPCCLLINYLLLKTYKNKRISLFINGLSALYIILFLWKIVGITRAALKLFLFLTSFVCAILICISITKYCDDKDFIFFSIGLCLMALVPVSGSDTGLLRLDWLLISFMPYILIQLIYKYNLQNRIGLIIIIAIIIVFAVFHRYKFPFNEESTNKLKYTINQFYQFDYIVTGHDNYELINDIIKDYDEINTKNIVFWGTRSIAFYELLNINNRFKSSFFMDPYDISDINHLEETIKERRPYIFFMPYYTFKDINIYNEVPITPVEEMILSKDYIVKRNDKYTLYIPTNK